MIKMRSRAGETHRRNRGQPEHLRASTRDNHQADTRYDTLRLRVSADRNVGCSLASLSAAIGRNPAYLHQFIQCGSPRKLPEDERRHLAIVLEVDERELGARDPWTPTGIHG